MSDTAEQETAPGQNETSPAQPDVESATAQTAPQGGAAEPHGHAPVPPAGAEAGAQPASEPTAPKEKQPWPKTQRGLIILVVVLALVLGFAGGVAGTLVIQATGLFQQDQQAVDASAMGGDFSSDLPDGTDGMGDMGTAPDSGDGTELGEVPGDLGGDTADGAASA